MGRPAEWLDGFARRTGMTVAGSGGASGLAWLAFGHSSVMVIIAAACIGGVVASLPKIFESVYKRRPAIIKAKGEAKAKVIDAKAKRIEAEVQKMNAASEARNSAKRTDAEVKDAARRTNIQAGLLRSAQKSGKINEAIALLRQQKLSTPPKEKDNDTQPPEDGPTNVHPIRPLAPGRTALQRTRRDMAGLGGCQGRRNWGQTVQPQLVPSSATGPGNRHRLPGLRALVN